MEAQLFNLVRNLSEDDIIDVLSDINNELIEDGYDSLELLSELILETKLYEFIDYEFLLTEAVNPITPGARRVLLKNQKKKKEYENKKKGRFGNFLRAQIERIKNLFSKKNPEEKKTPVRGIDYHLDLPRSRSSSRSRRNNRDEQPRQARGQSSSLSRRRSDREASDSGEGAFVSSGRSSRSGGSSESRGERSTSRSSRDISGRESSTTIRVPRTSSNIVTRSGIRASQRARIGGLYAARSARNQARRDTERQQQSQENIRNAARRMQQNPLARTGSTQTSRGSREVLQARGLTTVPDDSKYKTKSKPETSDQAIERAKAGGLSSRHVEMVRRHLANKDAAKQAERSAKSQKTQQERRAKEAAEKAASRQRRAAGRSFTGTRPVPQTGRPTSKQRRAEKKAEQNQRAQQQFNQKNRILSPEARQAAASTGVSLRKLGGEQPTPNLRKPQTPSVVRNRQSIRQLRRQHSRTPNTPENQSRRAELNQQINRLKKSQTFSTKGTKGSQEVMRARRLSSEAGVTRDPATTQERSPRRREFRNRQVEEMLLYFGYANTYDDAMIIAENLSDQYFNYLIEEYYNYDPQY